jgi:AraC family transcriptional regulator
MSDIRRKNYAARFGKVLDHIEAHLHEPLAAERLAEVAGFSRFHFHRQFADFIGVGVARYVLLMRLRRATYQIAFDRKARIIDVALEAGFENPESFTRAFRSAFGQSPSEFRRRPDWESWHERYWFRIPERNIEVKVDIVEFETTRVAVLEHRGPTEQLNATVGRFIEWRKSNTLSPKDSHRTFGVAWSNPDTTPPEDFRFDVCGEVKDAVPPNPQGVTEKEIPGGRCARVRHYGSHMRLGESIYPIYREWLPQSGEELRDFPLYCQRLSFFPEVAEHEAVAELFLPLK